LHIAEESPTKSILLVFAFALLVILVLSNVFLASVPPVSKDALTHHLAVPKLYLKHGGVYEIPSLICSYYPMNLDLLYLIPLHYGNDIVPKFLHMGFAILTAYLIFGYLKARSGSLLALYGVLFFLSIPIILRLSVTVYVDLGVIFFSTLALLYFVRWLGNDFKTKSLVLSGISCGLAMGVKYNGLICLFLLAVFFPFAYARYHSETENKSVSAIRHGLIFVAVALLVFSPWMLRNFSWTGNPIFPLFNHWFDPARDLSAGHKNLFAFRSVIYHESWWEMALLPFRVFLEGQDGNPRLFDGRLNPFLLVFPVFAFFRIREDSDRLRREKYVFLAFGVLYFCFALFTKDLRTRYIAPILPPMVILSALGIKGILDTFAAQPRPSVRKTIALGMILLILSTALLPNVRYLIRLHDEVNAFSFLSGLVTRDQYIARYREEYPVMQYINDRVTQDAKILFFFLGKRGYYCDRDYVLDMPRSISFFHEALKRSETPEQLLVKIRKMGITHFLIRHDLFIKWSTDNLTPGQRRLLREFFKDHVRLLYHKARYSISEIRMSVAASL
jgi:hypothetical protein